MARERHSDRGCHEQEAREPERAGTADPVRDRPQTQPPIATASTTSETESPAWEGLTPKSRESSGRIAWVAYIVANMPAAPSMKPASAFCTDPSVPIATGYCERGLAQRQR